MFDLLIHYPVIMKTIYIPETYTFSWCADTGIIDADDYRSYVLLIEHYDPIILFLCLGSIFCMGHFEACL